MDTQDTVILPWVKIKWPDMQGESWLLGLTALQRAATSFFQGHVILGPQETDGSIYDCLCPPAVTDAQQLSQIACFIRKKKVFCIRNEENSTFSEAICAFIRNTKVYP